MKTDDRELRYMEEVLDAINNMLGTSIKLEVEDTVTSGEYRSYITPDRMLLIHFSRVDANFWLVSVELRFSFPMRRLRIRAFDDESGQLRGARCLSFDLLPDGSLDRGSMSVEFRVYTKGVDRISFNMRFEDAT